MDLPPAVHEHFEALNAGAWRERAGAGSWTAYEERPLQAVTSGDVVAVRTHFTGTTPAGTRVELEPLTVFSNGRVDAWDGVIPALEVIGEYFRSSNAEDWAAFAQTWAENADLVAVGGPPRHGRADVVRAYQLFLGLFGRHEDHVERMVVTGRTAAVTGRFYGTNPQGLDIEFDWADVIDLTADERQIQRLSHWHDRDRFRKLMAAES